LGRIAMLVCVVFEGFGGRQFRDKRQGRPDKSVVRARDAEDGGGGGGGYVFNCCFFAGGQKFRRSYESKKNDSCFRLARFSIIIGGIETLFFSFDWQHFTPESTKLLLFLPLATRGPPSSARQRRISSPRI
jgi:hypothetical protein